MVCDGRVDLTSAQVGDLVDDTTSWAKVSAVDLDRFSYQHLQNPWTVEERLEWLAKDQETAGAFQPQPYQQLAKVYGEMGHDADRRRVLLEKEKLTTAAENARIQDALAETTADIIEAKRLAKLPTLQSSDHEILENERRYLRQLKNRTLQLRKARNLNTLWRGFLSLTIGYGYSPLRVLAWAAGLIVAAVTEDCRVERRTMVAARTDDGQELRAVNEVYVGHRSHQSARYRIELPDGGSERHSSSGVLAGTGTGATGWLRSAWEERASSLRLPAPASPDLCWFVREAWPSIATGSELTEGLVVDGDRLTLHVESDELVCFGDGIESDALRLTWGQRVSIAPADQTLNLVVAPAAFE